MSVTQSMLNMAIEHAAGRRITDIYLRVGQMSPIVPESVQLFFEYLSKDTKAEGASLHFEIVPLEIMCLDCKQLADLSEWSGERPQAVMVKALSRGCRCGSRNLRVTGGVSFGMTSIQVEDSATADGKE